MKILHIIDGFFFRRVSATMFGLMRASFGGFTLLYLLFQWNDVTYYYTEQGIAPQNILSLFVRSHWRFSILDYIDQPLAVHSLYLILCILLCCTMLGIRARISTTLSVLLLFSFHERNGFILGGGDTLLRSIGFILIFTPNLSGFSIDRARARWAAWKQKQHMPPLPTMPVWPWRLLLWQMIVLYGTSTWTKLLGTLWIQGTAVQTALHHPTFVRVPSWVIDPFMPLLPFVDYLSLLIQLLWIFLLIPQSIRWYMPSWLRSFSLLRILIAGGILFHASIFIFMDAGVFSLAIFTAYIGLLRQEDIEWLQKIFQKAKHSIIVLYDGHCGLCMRSMYILHLCDWLHILKPVDFRVVDDRRAFAPGITESKLDTAMHIRLADQTYLTGFDAFRYTTRFLPPLCFLYPLLHIPGVAPIGRRIYKQIADNRKKCSHENCSF